MHAVARHFAQARGHQLQSPLGHLRAERPLYAALAPHDPERLLCQEWANACGAIARFDRNAIEIRVVDVQECPVADVALAAAIIDLVGLFYEDDGRPQPPSSELAEILRAGIRDGERARIDSPVYGVRGAARDVWRVLAQRMRDAPHRALWQPFVEFVPRRVRSRDGCSTPWETTPRAMTWRACMRSCANAWSAVA